MKVGDIVEIKGIKHLMTVSKNDRKNSQIECMFFVDSKLYTKKFKIRDIKWKKN